MKKISLILSGLVVFSLAACTESSFVNSNAIDPSDLYKQKVTLSFLSSFNALGGEVSLPQETEYALRKYDSHNHVCLEQIYAQNKINLSDYEGENVANKSADYKYIVSSSTSYTNRYDKNGNLIYRFIFRFDRVGASNSSKWAINYGCENYSYDNLNRLVQKTMIGTVYGNPGVVSANPSLEWETTYTDAIEKYTYVGNSREYKTHTSYYVRTTEALLNATGVVTNKGFEITVRDFNEHNDISKQVSIDYNENIVTYNNGNIGASKNAVALIDFNTYDDHHCLTKKTTYKYFNNGSVMSLVHEADTTYSYYKNNPKKLSHSLKISRILNPSLTSNPIVIDVLSFDSCSYDYDSRGRLKNKTTTLRSISVGPLNSEHDITTDGSSAKSVTRTHIEMYSY